MAHEEERRWRERNWREAGERRSPGDWTRQNQRRDDIINTRFGESQGAYQGRSWDDRERWGDRSEPDWEQTAWNDLERDRGRGYGQIGDSSRSYSGRSMSRGSDQGSWHDYRHDRDYSGSIRSGEHGAGRSTPYSGSGGSSSGRSGMGYGDRRMESQSRGRERSDFNAGYGYGYGGPHDWGADSRDEERGFWDRASDEVSSWFGDEEAERRREMDRRHRGLGPRNYARSDTRITEDVCDRLTEHPMIDASDVEVAVSGREVTLSGTVKSRDEKRRAEDIAEAVSGVTHVQNNLRVKQQGESSVKSTLDSAANATSGAFGERGGSTMSSRSGSAAAGSASSNTGDTSAKTTTGSSPGVMRPDPSTSSTKG